MGSHIRTAAEIDDIERSFLRKIMREVRKDKDCLVSVEGVRAGMSSHTIRVKR